MDYISASTIPNIRAKHPDWISYLNRKYSYNVSVTLSTSKVSIDAKGKKIKSIAATHNYGRPCYYVFRAVGAYGYKKRNDGWNKSQTTHTFSLMGTKAGNYSAVIDLYDAKKKTKIASSKTFTINVGQVSSQIPITKKITVYRQTDKRWKAYPYGYSSATNRRKRIHAYLGQDNTKGAGYGGGCGVLSIVNAVYYLKGTFIQPKWLADFSVSTKARYDGGTYGWLAEMLCTKKGSDYGIKFVTDVANVEDAKAYLKRGNVAIIHVQGHFMALVNYDSKTDKYLVIDSCPIKNRGTSKGYRWLKANEFTGKMALSWTNEKKGRIHILSQR